MNPSVGWKNRTRIWPCIKKESIGINTVLYILVAILVFGFLILTHELGHFSVAKLCHIKVNEFALGMGPALFKIKRGETTYALRVLPIGGFCAMEGEDGESEDPRAFGSRPVWQRVLVVVAGAFTNILTGFIVLAIFVSMSQLVGTNVVNSFQKGATSSAAGGLQAGDKILSVNGSHVHVTDDIVYDLVLDGDGSVDFQVVRQGKVIDLNHVKFRMFSENGTKVIWRDFSITGIRPNSIGIVLHETFFKTFSMVRLVWMTFAALFTGRFGLGDLSGPIGTTAAVGQAVSMGINDLLYVMALIAVNLGVVNLLPLPALDGGRLIFLIVEAIRRKPVNPKYEWYVHFAGFALLMLLMVVVSYNDIVKLIKG